MSKDNHNFDVTLDIINNLSKDYQNSILFMIIEAISNAWDADAENVKIHLDDKAKNIVIQDDGIGMTRNDIKDKFLKVGFSKYSENIISSKKRIFLGSKGLGKLSYINFAKSTSIISKTINSDRVGVVFNDEEFKNALASNLTISNFELDSEVKQLVELDTININHGTTLYFENIIRKIDCGVKAIKTVIALWFKFIIYEKDFNIYINNEIIDITTLDKLINNTQFIWKINKYSDEYISTCNNVLKINNNLRSDVKIKGFVGSVVTSNQTNIRQTRKRISIDLFINGKFTESNIMQQFPDLQTRVPIKHLYGKIDIIDESISNFNYRSDSNRNKCKKYFDKLRTMFEIIIDEWDQFKLDVGESGDIDNPRCGFVERKSIEIFNKVFEEYMPLNKKSKNYKQIQNWANDIKKEATFNNEAYAHCMIAENLLRKYIEENGISYDKFIDKINEFKEQEINNKNKADINYELREHTIDLSYLSMRQLVNVIEECNTKGKIILTDELSLYTPIRNAVAHTSLLSEPAQKDLSDVTNKIKEKVRSILDDEEVFISGK